VIARRGFVLAVVLGALVLMAMLVALTAQRALLAVRQGALDAARAEIAAALAAGEADALESPPDSLAYRQPVGALLAAGDASAGRAAARWSIVATGTVYATVDVTAEAPVYRGVARELRRGLVVAVRDSAGGLRWASARGGNWVRLPSP
jgi:hypothetical protein